jgi:hypothetical protein
MVKAIVTPKLISSQIYNLNLPLPYGFGKCPKGIKKPC